MLAGRSAGCVTSPDPDSLSCGPPTRGALLLPVWDLLLSFLPDAHRHRAFLCSPRHCVQDTRLSDPLGFGGWVGFPALCGPSGMTGSGAESEPCCPTCGTWLDTS